jgi:hypothetical protein
MIDSSWLDYGTSPLNPLAKIVIFLIYGIIVLIYYNARTLVGGTIQKIIDVLFIFSVFMALASFFRIFGHGAEFGFNADFSLKWFQSLAYLAGAISLVYAARILLGLFRREHE